ncbi:MAG: transposase [Candidatus Zixiibacteriota bacterium]
MRSRNRNNYERYGDVYFITSTVAGFVDIFRHRLACDIFVDCLRFYQNRGDFTLLAWVLMPNHFHLVLKRSHNLTISQILGNIKRLAARRIGQLRISPEMCCTFDRLTLAAALEPGNGTALWKHRFDSLVIISLDTLRQKVEYIHSNPVRKGLVNSPEQWPYSSAAQYAGVREDNPLPIDVDWASVGFDKMPSGKGS